METHSFGTCEVFSLLLSFPEGFASLLLVVWVCFLLWGVVDWRWFCFLSPPPQVTSKTSIDGSWDTPCALNQLRMSSGSPVEGRDLLPLVTLKPHHLPPLPATSLRCPEAGERLSLCPPCSAFAWGESFFSAHPCVELRATRLKHSPPSMATAKPTTSSCLLGQV